uniref:Nuclear receptor domain-containing protein n=1 Tax=Strigamia maritima TaxID=126957 RepID=T1JF90_STRMM
MDNTHLCGKMAKICGVCGDKAKSFHFGGMSCDSCKAFFRRSVQNDVYKHFHCPHNGQCQVSMSSRKSCQFCRFEKCLSIGMMKNWVMSEDERQRLHQLRLEKKLSEEQKRKIEIDQQNVPPIATFLHEHLSTQEVNTLYELTSAYQSLLLADEFFTSYHSPLTFTRKILKLIHFAQCVPEFKILSNVDKTRLFHNSLYEMSLAVDACSHRPSVEGLQMPYSGSCSPTSSYSSISSSCSSNESSDDEYKCDDAIYFKPYGRLSKKLCCFVDDLRPFVLFLLVVLFNPDDSSLVDGARVAAIQEWYCDLLRRYLEWKIGTRKATVVFADLLLLLPELCEMKEKQSEQFVFGRMEDWEQATRFIRSSDCL